MKVSAKDLPDPRSKKGSRSPLGRARQAMLSGEAPGAPHLRSFRDMNLFRFLSEISLQCKPHTSSHPYHPPAHVYLGWDRLRPSRAHIAAPGAGRTPETRKHWTKAFQLCNEPPRLYARVAVGFKLLSNGWWIESWEIRDSQIQEPRVSCPNQGFTIFPNPVFISSRASHIPSHPFPHCLMHSCTVHSSLSHTLPFFSRAY